MPKHIFWPTLDSSSLYVTIYTWSRCCYTPNCWAWSLQVTWQRWRSNCHCRNPSAICKMHVSVFNTTRFIADWYFSKKIVENTEIFGSCCKSDADDAQTHFLAHYPQFQLVRYRSNMRSRCCFMPNRWARSLLVTWQR